MKLVTQFLTGVLLLIVLITPLHSTTYYVWFFGDDDSNTGLSWTSPLATLQKAVAQASDGDTILVGYDEQYGTVYEINSAIIVNKKLVISSARFGTDQQYQWAVPDSARCILTANFNNRLFTIRNDVEIRGLGLKKGHGAVGSAYMYGYGGAIAVDGELASYVRIHHCWLDSNYASQVNYDGYGGAIAIINAPDSVFILRNRFTNNVAATITNYNGYGGALAIITTDSNTYVAHNQFLNNTASFGPQGYGGAVFLEKSALLENNLIENNVASRHPVKDYQPFGLGGGIYARYGDGHLVIRKNTIRNNIASSDSVRGSGGGIYLWQCSDALIEENLIEGNRGSLSFYNSTGGGIEATGYGTNVRIFNNQILNNTAGKEQGEGGGIYINGGQVMNNIIRGNIAATNSSGSGHGGGIYAEESTTIWGNTIENNMGCSGADGTGWGGGVYSHVFDGGSDIAHNLFKNNMATYGASAKGGALFINDRSAVSYNVFYHNIATTQPPEYTCGDAIYIYYNADENLRIYHNVFFRNANAIHADQLNFGTLENQNIFNNIFYNTPAERAVEMIDSWGDMDIYNNCFYGYQYNNNNRPLKYNWNVFSYNEVDANPQLDTTTFVLRYDSPCIDAGMGFYTYNEEENHHLGWRPDIGVHEFSGVQVRKYITQDMVGDTLYFGGQVRAKIKLDSASVADSAYIEMVVYPGQQHPNAPAGIHRYYRIQPSGITDYRLTLWLSYKDSELNGAPEDQLQLVRYRNNRWEGPFFSDNNVTENWVSASHISHLSDWILTVDTSFVAIERSDDTLPTVYRLYPNFPNPFNPVTTIRFDLPEKEFVELNIFNTLGQKVRTLIQKNLPAGQYRVVWDGRSNGGVILPAGVYYLQIRAGSFLQTRKLTLIK